jgi:ABC-type uncharacterized transport system auxiliary subunit
VTVEQYALDYQAPAFPGRAPLAAGIKVARFSSAQEIAGTDMLIQPGPYQRQVWDYQRWRVSPADQVGDFLARDLRASGLFSLVLSHHDPSAVRFKLEGALERFQLSQSAHGPAAVLEISLTLLDIRERELPRRLIFQRGYAVEVPLAQPAPLDLAQGLSRALAQLSAKIVADLHQAVGHRLQESP